LKLDCPLCGVNYTEVDDLAVHASGCDGVPRMAPAATGAAAGGGGGGGAASSTGMET